MVLKFALSIIVGLAAFPAYADGSSLVGMSEEDIVACAGLPSGNMQIGSKTFFQYGASREAGAINGVGNTLFLSRHQTGCDATVTFQNDHVVQVTTRPYGGLLTGPIACGSLFASCRH